MDYSQYWIKIHKTNGLQTISVFQNVHLYTEDKNNKQNNILHFAKEDVEPHFSECQAN